MTKANAPQAVLPEDRVNILVVDDLPEKLLVYRTILDELGHNLITAQSGQEALKLVLKNDFAVILLDVNMPETNGFETANLIRQRKKSARTPIIFLTAFTDDVYAAQGYASGAVDYLLTPVMPEVLRTKVRVFIELYQMRRQAALQAEERAKRKAAEEMAARSAFLVTASEVLARSQNEEEILTHLAKVTIPFLADVSIVCINDESAQPEMNMKWAWKPAGNEVACESVAPCWQAFPGIKKTVHNAMENNRIEVMAAFPAVTLAEGGLAFPQLGPVLVLPFMMGGAVRGALILARRHEGASYDQSTSDVANDLVSRAKISLEKAILMKRIQLADQRKDEFLGMLAHELRNPLGPIFNAVQLMQRMGGASSPRMESIIDIVDRQVKHMSRLIDDLLDATRLARGKLLLRKEPCNLTTIVQQTAEDYRSIFDASGLQLNIDVPNKPVWVVGDPTRLVQAVGNLLHNAHKFTNPGGTIDVCLKMDDSAGSAIISIRDTGIGIEPEVLPTIFEVFEQAEQGLDRSRGGLGLGLALVKGLMQLHNGMVYAISEGAQKGAELIIQLPLTQPASLQAPKAAEAMEEKKGRGRILIIEDNHDTVESAQQLLTMEGYEVEIAYNGASGIEATKRFKPQVVLCDIGLPGMDGYQVVRALRQCKELAPLYIIALTGYGRDEDQRLAQEAGFDLHLTKPIDYMHLRRTLMNVAIREKTQSQMAASPAAATLARPPAA